MEKRLALEMRGKLASEIEELNLDNCRSTSIMGLTDEFTNLVSLSLINVGLTTLKGFPKLPNLKKLELSDNRISNGLNYLASSPKLSNLNLSGNKIKDLDELKPLEGFKNLAVLDLFNNEATQSANYRTAIFEMIPSLRYLDGFDSNDMEATSEEEDIAAESDDDQCVGSFMVNGMEIDLDELRLFELSLEAKKLNKDKCNGTEVTADAAVDEIDEYLEKLALDIKERNDAVAPTEPEIARPQSTTSYATLVLTLLSIICFINSVLFMSDAVAEDEDVDDDSVDDEEEDDGVLLADVYNENLEEDSSDWNEASSDWDQGEDLEVYSEECEEDEGEDGANTTNESTNSKKNNSAAAGKPAAAAGKPAAAAADDDKTDDKDDEKSEDGDDDAPKGKKRKQE